MSELEQQTRRHRHRLPLLTKVRVETVIDRSFTTAFALIHFLLAGFWSMKEFTFIKCMMERDSREGFATQSVFVATDRDEMSTRKFSDTRQVYGSPKRL